MTRSVVLVSVLGFCGIAFGHEMRPAYLEITEVERGAYDVAWKVPARGEGRLALDVIFDPGTVPVGESVDQFIDNTHVRRWRVERPGGLDGSTVVIDRLSRTFTDVLVRIAHLDGRQATFRVTPEKPRFVVDAAPGWGRLAGAYVMLGIEHIVLGVDHLLFVLGLLLIVDCRRMLIKTITAFTIAHSITLAASTFGVLHVAEGPLNACIALSILFLGPEVVRRWRGESSFTIRHPWVVAFGFGLLHGIGFASGLSVAGLPDAAIPMALLWFNLGVELGQGAFIALVFALLWAWRRLGIEWPPVIRRAPGYSVGVLGAFWTIDRIAAMLVP